MDTRGGSAGARVDLYWLPLGAGGTRLVRWSGRVFERIVAAGERRAPCDLYHSALAVTVGSARYTIEVTPAWGNREPVRGVVQQGPVGHVVLGRSRCFRYEVRCWAGGRIPDAEHAVDSPRCLTTSDDHASRILALVPQCPALTWGRDEAGAGEMWNSNSLVSWLLVASGRGLAGTAPPCGGRAPGWWAGARVAARCRRPLPAAPDVRPGG